ncbi:MAG: Gfo/Idh/MocA family oxidoreductase [Novosphingobium sp.]|nr:Gfo/Idh/MocA family oxidoreductase [Novosphingobium sp.]
MTDSPNSPLRAVVVGTGFGCRIQTPALQGAGFEVVGLVGTDPDRTAERAKLAGVPHGFTELGEAIDVTGADVVVISSTPHTHARLSIQALESGCHVLCEKPFAKDGAEARAMLAAARKAGKVHMIGHEFRFDPLRATFAKAIADGMIGDPRFVSIITLIPQIPFSEHEMPAWWFEPAEGGGWLGALGSHVFDQLRVWFGEFASVSGSLETLTATRGPVDDSFTVHFEMKNGAAGVIQSSAGTFGPMLDVTRASGSDGTLWTEGGAVHFAGRDGTRELEAPAEYTLPEQPPIGSDPRFDSDRWRTLVGVELAPYTALCQSLKSAALGVPPASTLPAATFEDGVACMEVMDAIRASAANGSRLVDVGSV